MPMTQTEIIGFCTQVAQFLEENAEIFRAAGFDITARAVGVKGNRDSAATADAEQDEMKVMLKTKSGEVKAKFDLAYRDASTLLDAAIGVIGKTTPLGRQAAKIRSSVNRKNKKKGPDSQD